MRIPPTLRNQFVWHLRQRRRFDLSTVMAQSAQPGAADELTLRVWLCRSKTSGRSAGRTRPSRNVPAVNGPTLAARRLTSSLSARSAHLIKLTSVAAGSPLAITLGLAAVCMLFALTITPLAVQVCDDVH